MAITEERFAQGMTYEAYKAQMTRNRELLEQNEQTVKLASQDVAFFAQLEQQLRVVVLTEDWCLPGIENIPVLMRLAAESGRLDARFFLRDQNPDLMDRYLKDGVHRTIPTFAFLDQDFHDLGQWFDRPAKIREMLQAMFRDLWATDPVFADVPLGTPVPELPEAARQRWFQALMRFHAETCELSDREFVREIRELVAQGLSRST